MKRLTVIVVLMVAALTSAVPSLAIGQTTDMSSTATTQKTPATPKMTEAQKIALAMGAGPTEIAKNATIVDMTDMSGGQMKQLRAGTNGWVCYAFAGAPMCLDKAWQKWMEAWMSKSELKVESTGIGYMLRGDQGASNTDPYATAPTADNQWAVSPAHVMVLYQDRNMLDAYPTDPKSGGPWVMWKGTPYAHVMVPVSLTKAVTMSAT
jgi:ribosomal protein S11